MIDTVVAFDTSNYKTSAALYCPDTGEWKSVGRFLDVKLGSLGLRQNDALFMHTKALPLVVSELDLRNKRIIGAAYSDKPRDLEDSYMPCFLAGSSFAESLSHLLDVPCRSFSHQKGHIASAAFSCDKMSLLKAPFFAWHLSGGTTELLHVFPEPDKVFKTEICGGTEDISAGQLIDRTGVALGFPFPSGKYVEEAALRSVSNDYFKVKIRNGFFSLSGIENKVKQMIGSGVSADNICSYVLKTVAFAVFSATSRICGGEPVLFSGGVSVCSVIQKAFSDCENVFFARSGLGGDNAMGAALLYAETEKII